MLVVGLYKAGLLIAKNVNIRIVKHRTEQNCDTYTFSSHVEFYEFSYSFPPVSKKKKKIQNKHSKKTSNVYLKALTAALKALKKTSKIIGINTPPTEISRTKC